MVNERGHFKLHRKDGGVSARVIAEVDGTVLYDACWFEGNQRVVSANLACSSKHFWERYS